MKYFDWNSAKNERLQIDRGISFEDVVLSLEAGGLLDDLESENPKYPNQRRFVVRLGSYAFVVPYVEDEEKCFLKTIIPSRKMTKQYLERKI